MRSLICDSENQGGAHAGSALGRHWREKEKSLPHIADRSDVKNGGGPGD